MIPIHKLIE
uniref:Uncharacterized protein n=1 Tax=Vitis vinifera TaxID=29760 RepID=F6GXP0_VITVI